MSQPLTGAPDRLQAALGDRYRIERELGRGGMATVWLAHDLKHDRQVAIKVMRPELVHVCCEPDRFLHEIRVAARLAHPQIVPLHDSGNREGILYYVMPYIGGESLRQRLHRETRLPVDDALRIARALARALDYAHRQGVLHRDIKPENILIQEGHPVLADFGVARAIAGGAEGVTEPGVAVGTPAYMSPEQAGAERELDGRSDLYSLACVLYEMLAGRPPFANRSAAALMADHATRPPPPVRTLRPEVPRGVERALTKALSKEADQRFATMLDFVTALQATAVPEGPRTTDAIAVAVLPFVNASPDSENEYFSDGMTDELINALSKVEGLRVAPRSSAFALKGKSLDVRAVGAMLNAAAVLEGTVRQAGKRLRITAQLSDTTDGRLLWSERFDRTMEDVFTIQDEIAATIVNTLRSRLLGDLGQPATRRYTQNVKAYDLYLKGRFYWNLRTQAAVAEAIRYFELAIAEDARYAPAYAGLADAYGLGVDYRGAPVAEAFERAKREARKALELDDTLAEAHTSLAWVSFIYDWDWTTAEAEFRRAIELDAGYATAHQWYAWLLVAHGRFDEALAEGRAGVELDPTSVSARRGFAWLHYYARRAEGGIEHVHRAIAMNPTAEENRRILGLICAQLGRFDEAERAFREAIAQSDETAYAAAALGYALARSGRRREAELLLAELEERARGRYVSPVALVILHVALGDADRAFAELERAYGQRRGWMAYLAVEPILDPLRADPRFASLLDRMRL